MASFVFTKLDVEEGRFWTFVAALVVAAVTFASVLALKGLGGVTALLSSSRPPLLAESVIRFQLEPGLWPLAVAISLVTCSVLLADFGRTSSHPLRLTALALALLAAGLAALWSANPLTTIISWALYDLFFLLGQVAAGARRNESVRALALGSVASLLLWMGVLVAGNGTGSVQWSLMPAGGPKMTFWVLAGLLRLGVYPLHLSIPGRLDASSPPVTMLFLSPVIGWGLWGRLALVNDGPLPVSPWMMLPGLLTLVAGGLLAWTARSSRDTLPWIGMGANGAVLCSSVLASLSGGGQSAGESVALAILVLGVTSWTLGIVVLLLADGLVLPITLHASVLPSIPSLLGALSLVGAPITLGFVAESYLMGGLARLGQWGWVAGFFAGQMFLVAAVARWLIPITQPEELDVRSLESLVPAAGWLGSALFLIVGGLVPNLLLSGSFGLSLGHLLVRPSLIGWLLWGASLLLGGVLAWQDAYLRPRISLWLDALHDVVRFDWAWDLLIDAFDRGLSLVRIADDILGGKGALLWSFIILLILILAWRVR